MVVLNKIYTRTGDAGETALGNGARVAKHSARVNAYGTSDELNCFVGVARIEASGKMDAALSRIQNDLFDLLVYSKHFKHRNSPLHSTW